MSRLVRGLLLAAIIACFFVWSTGRAVDNELASGGVLSGRDVGATVDGSLAASRPESAEPPVVKHGVLSERGDISLAAQGSGPRTSGLGGRGTPRSESTIRKTFGTGLVAVNGHGPEWHRWQRVKDKRRLEQTVSEQGRTIRRLQAALRHRWEPTVDYAYRLAATVYGVNANEMRAIGSCESHHYPYARNGQYRGVMQEGPMFERGPFGRAGFSVFDPIANVLTAAHARVQDKSWRQWECARLQGIR